MTFAGGYVTSLNLFSQSDIVTRGRSVMSGHIATAQCEIGAPPEKVWRALTDPELIKKYMFGSEVKTDWKPGSPITWTGEFEGRQYQDKGEIIAVEPERLIEVTHFSRSRARRIGPRTTTGCATSSSAPMAAPPYD
jgi:uncharacterized protein YndB with AHSA1/START domain